MRSARADLGMVYNMALIKALMQRLENGWTQRQDCYKGRHKLRAEKVWKTDNLFFLQAKCKRCGVRKVTSTRLED